MPMELLWHRYKYYPYEKSLAIREARSLLHASAVDETPSGVRVFNPAHPELAERLVYFSTAIENSATRQTLQARLERVNGNGKNRQSTRYSAHGLHEYKGRFNPQVAKAILNINALKPGSLVLDPFCGSGTSLVEAAQAGMRARGADINPLAVFLANAKLQSLRTSPDHLLDALRGLDLLHGSAPSADGGARRAYLESWFPPDVLVQIEKVRWALESISPDYRPTLAACASNLLREYSFQDPMDLRIRRRKSPLPERPFTEAFSEAVERYAYRMAQAQAVLGSLSGDGRAVLLDSRRIAPGSLDLGGEQFDCVLTSPPYATALPYIDTQRLSLVWLGLAEPQEIRPLEAGLVGSREIQGVQERRALSKDIHENRASLPEVQATYCLELQSALADTDGFRRQAVPVLLYRYFADMMSSFRAVRSVVKRRAPYVLIVGGNHTVLGGKRFEIDTPKHLAELAQNAGWRTVEIMRLETYQRYGYHMRNAVAAEAMLVLEAA